MSLQSMVKPHLNNSKILTNPRTLLKDQKPVNICGTQLSNKKIIKKVSQIFHISKVLMRWRSKLWPPKRSSLYKINPPLLLRTRCCSSSLSNMTSPRNLWRVNLRSQLTELSKPQGKLVTSRRLSIKKSRNSWLRGPKREQKHSVDSLKFVIYSIWEMFRPSLNLYLRSQITYWKKSWHACCLMTSCRTKTRLHHRWDHFWWTG